MNLLKTSACESRRMGVAGYHRLLFRVSTPPVARQSYSERINVNKVWTMAHLLLRPTALVKEPK